MPHEPDQLAHLRHCNLATIVATIGPASESPEMVRSLIENGVGVFRLNFSHGDLAGHGKRLATIRRISREMNRPVAVLGDLQGPKIRIGKIPAGVGKPHPSGGGSIELSPGQDVVLKRGIDAAFIREGPAGPEPVFAVTYPEMVGEVLDGQKILINDGAIRMLAVSTNAQEGELRCRVVVGGVVSSGKGINLPQTAMSAPAMSDRDWECAQWAVENDLDFLALSFVRKAEEVLDLKARIATLKDPQNPSQHAWMPIISKIEKPQALENLESILEASDAVMVARGDLGVEMEIAKVPLAQKNILAACAAYGKPAIVATQMLETMIDSAVPTRAEASDVANAIFDGADAVMLSAETATGKHPALVVETMARIVNQAEWWLRQRPAVPNQPVRLAVNHRGTAALAHGAWAIAAELGCKTVACWSENGGTARYLSQNRLHVPILAYSTSERSCRRMTLLRGVRAICTTPPGNGTLSEWHEAVDAEVVRRNLAQPGDAIVMLAGRPLGRAKATNTITIHRVGDSTTGQRQG